MSSNLPPGSFRSSLMTSEGDLNLDRVSRSAQPVRPTTSIKTIPGLDRFRRWSPVKYKRVALTPGSDLYVAAERIMNAPDRATALANWLTSKGWGNVGVSRSQSTESQYVYFGNQRVRFSRHSRYAPTGSVSRSHTKDQIEMPMRKGQDVTERMASFLAAAATPVELDVSIADVVQQLRGYGLRTPEIVDVLNRGGVDASSMTDLLGEEVPAVSAGSGAIAGIGVGPQGEPGVRNDPAAKARRARTAMPMQRIRPRGAST